jgi:hypothetical protein
MPTKHTPQEAARRDVKAVNRRLAQLDARIEALHSRLSVLEHQGHRTEVIDPPAPLTIDITE